VSDDYANTRTTCYQANVLKAARALCLPDGSTADDVLKRIIAGQEQATVAQARQCVNKWLDLYEGADSHALVKRCRLGVTESA